MTLDLSESNKNVDGKGLNPNATTVINDIFKISNQGTQPVGVWLEINPVQKNNRNVVSLYRDSAQNAPVTGPDNAICLGVGDHICIGLVARTEGVSPDDYGNLFEPVEGEDGPQMVVHADADATCGDPSSPPDPNERRLDTGEAGWQVTSGPGINDEDTPISAEMVNPPDAWATSEEASWVDPFGTGGLKDDPANDDEPYVYELEFEVNAGRRELAIEEYGSDNPVEFFLENESIGGFDGEGGFAPLKSDISNRSLEGGTYTLRAEVINLQGSNRNPTGLLVAARLK
jgi:hypothetical protein